MHATVAKPSNLGGVVRSNPDGKPPQLLKSQRLEAGEELVKLYANLYVEGTRCEFDSSAVKDYTPDETSETYSSAALRRYDRRHGVNHYLLSPSSNLSFAKYPSTANEQSINGLGPLPIEQSLESKIFGWDRDDAPPAVLHRAPPNPWKFPIVDAPLVINPRILVRNTAARTLNFSTAPTTPFTFAVVAQPSHPVPVSLESSSRPTIRPPLRAAQNHVPLASSTASTESSSDYSTAHGGGNKRKAINPPEPRPQKKATPVSRPPQTAPRRPQRPILVCGTDGCLETFDNEMNLQRHQQRHLHSRHRICCNGCPAVFARMEDLHGHLSHSAGCTTEKAAQLLQTFYLQPEIVAINPAGATQKELMAYWRRFLEVAINVSR